MPLDPQFRPRPSPLWYKDWGRGLSTGAPHQATPDSFKLTAFALRENIYYHHATPKNEKIDKITACFGEYFPLVLLRSCDLIFTTRMDVVAVEDELAGTPATPSILISEILRDFGARRLTHSSEPQTLAAFSSW